MAQTTIRDTVEIYGVTDGADFSMELSVTRDSKESMEEGIIRALNSRASNFEELAVARGWRRAYWTYKNVRCS
jgi:hypothetical protein